MILLMCRFLKMIKIHIFCITSEGFFFNLLPSQRFLPTPPPTVLPVCSFLGKFGKIEFQGCGLLRMTLIQCKRSTG